jgi:type II secretory pathway pseudopilin PulG
MTVLRRLRSENGSALPVVVGVMLIIGILVSVIHQTSNRVAESTTKERAEKRAFQAAEAGLHVAMYRLNKMLPEPEECLTTEPVDPGAGAPCPATPAMSVGSGATYSYTVTRPLTGAGSSECEVPSGLNFDDFAYRCVTSIGTAKGQTRRVQAFVQIPLQVNLFPVNGVFALGTLTAGQNLAVNGELGSNTHVGMGVITPPNPGLALPAGATRSPTSVPITRVLDAPFQGKTYDAHFTKSMTAPLPDNASWPTGGGTGFTLNSQKRTLSGGSAIGSATTPLGIPAGTYNFCNVSLNNATYLRPLGPVTIYIDSPARTGSGCDNNTGNFIANNNLIFRSSPADAAMIHIEMYGGTGTRFEINNNFDYTGTLYAPNSTVEFKNNAAIQGAIVGRTVTMNNNLTLTGQIPEGLTGGEQEYSSSSWIECVRTPSSSSAGSGC